MNRARGVCEEQPVQIWQVFLFFEGILRPSLAFSCFSCSSCYKLKLARIPLRVLLLLFLVVPLLLTDPCLVLFPAFAPLLAMRVKRDNNRVVVVFTVGFVQRDGETTAFCSSTTRETLMESDFDVR